MPTSEQELAKRVKLRMLRLLPRLAISMTLMLDPKRAMPFSDRALPARTRLRSAIELPSDTRSRVDSENNDPNRARPTADKELPSLAKSRTERQLPKHTRLITDS
jgi:hypothetical protein